MKIISNLKILTCCFLVRRYYDKKYSKRKNVAFPGSGETWKYGYSLAKCVISSQKPRDCKDLEVNICQFLEASYPYFFNLTLTSKAF